MKIAETVLLLTSPMLIAMGQQFMRHRSKLDGATYLTAVAADGTPWFAGYAMALVTGAVVLVLGALWRRRRLARRRSDPGRGLDVPQPRSLDRWVGRHVTLRGRLRLPGGSRLRTIAENRRVLEDDEVRILFHEGPSESPTLEVDDDSIPLVGWIRVHVGAVERWGSTSHPLPAGAEAASTDPLKVVERALADGDMVHVLGELRGVREAGGGYRDADQRLELHGQPIVAMAVEPEVRAPWWPLLRLNPGAIALAFGVMAALSFNGLFIQHAVNLCVDGRCQSAGECAIEWHDERWRCVGTERTCQASDGCARFGHCGVGHNHRCEPTRDAHCLESKDCIEEGRCRRAGRWCARGPAEPRGRVP